MATALRRAAASLDSGPIFLHHGCLEPSFDVQQHPLTCHMFPNGPQQKVVVDVIEQAFDVEL